MKEESVRDFLSDVRLWIVIAYFGLVAVIVGIVVLYNSVADEQDARLEEQRIASENQVTRCFEGIDARGLEIQAIRAMVNAFLFSAGNVTDNVERRAIYQAIARLDALADSYDLNRPRRNECRELARQLGVSTDGMEQRTGG